MKRILVTVLCLALLAEGATLLVFRRGTHRPPAPDDRGASGGPDLARTSAPSRPPAALALAADGGAEVLPQNAEEEPVAPRRDESAQPEADHPKVGPDSLARCLACATSDKGAFCQCNRNCVACNLKVTECDRARINDFFAQARACTCLMNRCPQDCPVSCF